MVLQKIYVQYEYHESGYFLPDAELYVRDSMTGGDLFGEICYSAFDGVSTGCGFNLTEGWTYDVFSGKEGYKTGSGSQLLEFPPPVNPYILLWLYPREPTVVTHDVTWVSATEADLSGEVTDMDGLSKVFAGFQYGKVGESYTQGDEWASDYPEAIWDYLSDLTPGTTYNFRARVSNRTDEDTFYVFGETKQFTTLTAPTYDMRIILPNANGKLFLSNTIIACEDYTKACTEFRFQIRNDGNTTIDAWYKVSVVGGGTLYDSTIASLNPGATSVVIDDWVCALSGGLPVGTHTIKVETGPGGQAATDSHSEDIFVIEEPHNDATFVSQTVPLSMITGESYDVSITMRNTGTITWSEAGRYRLGSPNLIWGLDRAFLPPDTTVLPEAEWTFTFSITAPTEAGDYNFQWVMVEEYVEVFGEYTENLIITVAPEPCNDATFVSQTVPLSMITGESYEVSITMRNTGTATWSEAGRYRLGSPNLIWGLDRAFLPPDTTVLPEAEWTFTFSITAPTEAGDYNFQWVMVEEYVEVFGEYTENLIITVAPESVLEPPSGIFAGSVDYLNVCGGEIANNCVIVDIVVEHFGSDNECSIYLEYWSEGDTEHNFTTPIVVPYDPLYDEYGGFEIQGVTACIPDCERAAHIRAVASNSVGTNYSETVTPITVRLEAPTEITQTSVTLNAYISTMGSVTTGIALFRYGTSTPDTFDYPEIPISSTGAISRTITGLVPNTTYQYYLLARNKYGYPQTKSGTVSFTTLSMPGPAVNTGGADTITQTGAILAGLLSDSNDVSTHIGFEYGETESYGTTIWDSYASTFTSYNTEVSGLNPGTTYHFRAIATNEYGTSHGDDNTFATLAELYDITFVATAPGISDLHNVDVNEVTDTENPLYLGST